ncbi:N-acetylglucosamine-6-phosphate deacetylase [Paenibacillus sp. IB182496]|uniref:N-acetylglucosamine-6-phosphate deacetylase n=1 Tax=Paenibacillus sabuli TaxID=2772509 RepID=A0A927GU44_9BACL|nr:N-acetylglucosamine-6-phosphate deacetylase [Paenibacillus sabuli]MBD2848283.1 N-acetylglucosamine-6-phosphate deacetylase [Paenibacillus sabuli]
MGQQPEAIAIVGGRVVLPDGVLEDGVLLVEGGLVAACGPAAQVSLPASARRVDAQGLYVGPGLIDMHCHGGGGVWAWEDPYRMALAHLRCGTTGILPTMVYNQSEAELLEGVRRVLNVGTQPYSAAILGIHMEGPYINAKYGAVTAPIRPVNPAEYERLLALAGARIKLWTLAPELEGQRAFAEAAAAHGITLSVGHSEATPEAIYDLVPLGLRVGCHCTNASGATPSPSRYGGTREVGVDEAVLVHDEIYAEVIPDQEGVHVRPLMCRLILKTKGVDRVVVITDALREASGDERESDVIVVEGVGLSGSRLTMNRALRNMGRHTGATLPELFKMGSLNPARVLGLSGELGSLEPGKRANVVLVTPELDVRRVMLDGRFVTGIEAAPAP